MKNLFLGSLISLLLVYSVGSTYFIYELDKGGYLKCGK